MGPWQKQRQWAGMQTQEVLSEYQETPCGGRAVVPREVVEFLPLQILNLTVCGSEQPALGDPAWSSRGWSSQPTEVTSSSTIL